MPQRWLRAPSEEVGSKEKSNKILKRAHRKIRPFLLYVVFVLNCSLKIWNCLSGIGIIGSPPRPERGRSQIVAGVPDK